MASVLSAGARDPEAVEANLGLDRPTRRQVAARHEEINTLCGQLAALAALDRAHGGGPSYQCPAGYRP